MRRSLLWATAGFLGYTALKEILGRSRYLDLRGKTVLITGGSRGLGLLLVREFARAGARVALCARNGGELERVRDELAWMGRQLLTFSPLQTVCCRSPATMERNRKKVMRVRQR